MTTIDNFIELFSILSPHISIQLLKSFMRLSYLSNVCYVTYIHPCKNEFKKKNDRTFLRLRTQYIFQLFSLYHSAIFKQSINFSSGVRYPPYHHNNMRVYLQFNRLYFIFFPILYDTIIIQITTMHTMYASFC